MMKAAKAPTILIATVLLAACSAEIEVREINQKTIAQGTQIDGVPFRKKSRYEVEILELQEDGQYKPVADLKDNVKTLPDPERLYVLQFTGGPLANAGPTVSLNSDSTLKEIKLKTDSQGDEALGAIEKQVTAVQEERDRRETEKQTNLTTQDNLLVSYYDAKIAAEQAQLEYDALSSPTIVDKSKLELAKRKANIAARNAGKIQPYPNIGS